MDRFPYDAEARDNKLQQLVDARITATENDILAGRTAIVRAVAEKAETLKCDADEAEALVRAAVLGKVALVGTRIFEVVQLAIYVHVLPLAQQDLANAERSRAESQQNARIERRVFDRVFAGGV